MSDIVKSKINREVELYLHNQNEHFKKIYEHDLTERKKCVGCGYCCIRAMCRFGLDKHGYHKVCPSLFWDGKKYRCDLVKENYKNIVEAMEINIGCCSNLNTWRNNVKERNFEEIENLIKKVEELDG